MTINTALTREQKLLAEIVVQLGNITEAIGAAAAGEDSTALNLQIDHLQGQVSSLANERATLTTQLAQTSLQVAELQQQLVDLHAQDITPDNITEVMNHLGINYNNDATGDTGSSGPNSSY